MIREAPEWELSEDELEAEQDRLRKIRDQRPPDRCPLCQGIHHEFDCPIT